MRCEEKKMQSAVCLRNNNSLNAWNGVEMGGRSVQEEYGV